MFNFVDFCHKNLQMFFGALLQNCLDQEVQKSSNFPNKLI